MPDALWLPDAIRDMGVEPVEVDGWQTRGHSDLYPEVVVSHHTADGPNGIIPSLNICMYGAPYTAPGPLSNIVQSREPGYGRDKAYIIAARTSYNAGTGGWNGVSGNDHTIGNEIEHTGTAPLPQHRVETACKIAAGCLLAMEMPVDNHCMHWEWSWPPGSKIDPCCRADGGSCSGGEWRDLTGRYMAGGGSTPAPINYAKGTNGMVVEIIDAPGQYRFVWADNYAHIDRDLALSLIFGAGGFPEGRALPHIKWNGLTFLAMATRFGWAKVKD
jgi:hypothetical protein